MCCIGQVGIQPCVCSMLGLHQGVLDDGLLLSFDGFRFCGGEKDCAGHRKPK